MASPPEFESPLERQHAPQEASSQSPPYNAAEDLIGRNLSAGRAGKIAIIDDAGAYTYGDLADRVNRCAAALLALGLQPGQRLVLCLLDGIDFYSCFLGAIKAGVIPIPLNTLFQPSDYAAILRDSGTAAIVCSQSLLPVLLDAIRICAWTGSIVVSGDSNQKDFPQLSDLMSKAAPLQRAAATRSDDPCFWLYSSGSTGAPKGAIHRQRSMMHTAELFAVGILHLRESDVIYSAAKLFFAYGLGNALTFPLAVGGTAILYPGRATTNIVGEILRKHKPTIFCGVPTLFAALLSSSDLPNRNELALRLCTSAGEALPEGIGRAWSERTGVEIVDGLGSTEMLHIFISNRPGGCRYGTSGKPVPGYRLRLLDEHRRESPPGEMGDLYVSGATAAAGYWNNPEKTQSTFQGEWVKTGDRYHLDPEGNYVYCGRSDEMLKVSGIWVSPIEVESALLSHPAVLEAAVIGSPDENGLTRPKAFVVLKSGFAAAPELATELQVFVKGRLAPYKYPRSIQFVEELPKTATGKIRRNVLRQGSGQ